MRKTQIIPLPVLAPIKEHRVTNATNTYSGYVVPSGKRWNIRYIRMHRTIAAQMDIVLSDGVGGEITVMGDSVTDIFWEPHTMISLPAGWVIACYWRNGPISLLLLGEIILEETDEY